MSHTIKRQQQWFYLIKNCSIAQEKVGRREKCFGMRKKSTLLLVCTYTHGRAVMIYAEITFQFTGSREREKRDGKICFHIYCQGTWAELSSYYYWFALFTTLSRHLIIFVKSQKGASISHNIENNEIQRCLTQITTSLISRPNRTQLAQVERVSNCDLDRGKVAWKSFVLQKNFPSSNFHSAISFRIRQ